MFKTLSITTLLLLVLSTNELFAQDEIIIPAGDSTIVFSPLRFLNAYADAVGIDNLSEVDRSDSIHLRLWASFTNRIAALFLDIKIDSDQISGKWYASWVNNPSRTNRTDDYETWNCISEVQTVSTEYGERSGCLIGIAETEELGHIRELVFDTEFIELVRQPLERRVQLDGRSLRVELLDQDGYEFRSFMHYHIVNHPQKELIGKAITVLGLWQNFAPQ